MRDLAEIRTRLAQLDGYPGVTRRQKELLALQQSDRQEMTILFADIVGFSDLGERLTPSLLVTVLNRHFTLQAEAVQAQFGVVDKFQGDGLLAFWGAPFVEAADQARLALASARAQIIAMERLQRELPELTGLRRDPPTASIRIGIAKGDVLVGNIGSTAACNFTVIGDSVNLAARVESLNRVYGTLLLLDDNAAEALGPDEALREIDCVVVKGRREATRLFTLLQFQGEPTAHDYELQALYQEALLAYRHGDWAVAAAGLRACLAHTPGDGPAGRPAAAHHCFEGAASGRLGGRLASGRQVGRGSGHKKRI